MEAPRGGPRLSSSPGSQIHPAAAEGFARAADAYERARPGYPEDAVQWLDARLGPVVVDLAAGTGKLTRALAARGREVIAVEPVAEMRAAIGPPAHVRAGTAEAIPVPDAGADAVTVAQAFHWFDGPRALAEIHRVLRPGGVLALIWNRRRMEDDIHRALEELMAPHRGEAPAHRSEAWRAAFETTELFGRLEEQRFPNEQRVDADALADRVASVSFIATLGDAEREPLLAAVRAMGPATLRYVTEVQVTRRRD